MHLKDRKSRVSYPGPRFLSSATCPSLPNKHYNGLNVKPASHWPIIKETEGPQSVVRSDEICSDYFPPIVSIPLPDRRTKSHICNRKLPPIVGPKSDMADYRRLPPIIIFLRRKFSHCPIFHPIFQATLRSVEQWDAGFSNMFFLWLCWRPYSPSWITWNLEVDRGDMDNFVEKKYPSHFRKAWEDIPEFSPWLREEAGVCPPESGRDIVLLLHRVLHVATTFRFRREQWKNMLLTIHDNKTVIIPVIQKGSTTLTWHNVLQGKLVWPECVLSLLILKKFLPREGETPSLTLPPRSLRDLECLPNLNNS